MRCETGNYHLADPQGLSDRITSSSLTQRGTNFRQHISDRDGDRCVVTAIEARQCDAVHIISLKKVDEGMLLNFVINVYLVQ